MTTRGYLGGDFCVALFCGCAIRMPDCCACLLPTLTSLLLTLPHSPFTPVVRSRYTKKSRKMPVPRRRKTLGRKLFQYPLLALKLFDADFMFQKTKTLLLWGFLPCVIFVGMNTEPMPSSYLELINILE